MLKNNGSPAFYRLAGQSLQLSPSIHELLPFRLETQPAPGFPLPDNLQELCASAPDLKAEGWIAERLETISLWRDEGGILLQIPSAGLYWISADGAAIQQVPGPPELEPSILAQSLLGPPLVLALALRSVWCLHASAISFGDKALVFLGNSRAGKSTLAGFIDGQPGARRLGDDILPISLENGGLCALPHFPQLKLPVERQPGLNFPEKLALSAIYLLEEGPQIAFEALKPASAALTMASHSVAARLFDRALLSAHLDFCIQVALAAPVRRLVYPRFYAELPAVWQALQIDLAGLHV